MGHDLNRAWPKCTTLVSDFACNAKRLGDVYTSMTPTADILGR
jgi:hypothetical protein